MAGGGGRSGKAENGEKGGKKYNELDKRRLHMCWCGAEVSVCLFTATTYVGRVLHDNVLWT